MHRTAHFNIHRILIGLSTATLGLAIACSDTSGPIRASSSDPASADRGGGSQGGNNNDNNDNHGNRGPGNQDNPDQGNRGPGNQNDTTQQRTRVTITLTAPANAPMPRASGKAQLDQRTDRTELEVEIEHIAAGTVVTFFAGAAQLGGPVTADALGEAEIKLDSRRDTVPAIAAGTVITVKNAAGATLVSGTF